MLDTINRAVDIISDEMNFPHEAGAGRERMKKIMACVVAKNPEQRDADELVDLYLDLLHERWSCGMGAMVV
jgi:hypothetical protein